jgi:plastocyanin domain-containing protein
MRLTMVAAVGLIMGLGILAGCVGSHSTGPMMAAGSNRVDIIVTPQGFEPSSVEVTHGQPVTMRVTRTTNMTCATEMHMPSHGIHIDLPLNRTMEVTFPCDSIGTMTYTCGMGMMRGMIVAR